MTSKKVVRYWIVLLFAPWLSVLALAAEPIPLAETPLKSPSTLSTPVATPAATPAPTPALSSSDQASSADSSATVAPLPQSTLVSKMPKGAAESNVLDDLVASLREGQPISTALKNELLQTADGQFVMGRFYEYGSYGVPVNGEKAYGLYRLAAESGQMQAALYCWNRCLPKTPQLGESIEKAAKAGDPTGLYLWSRWLGEQGRLAPADEYLVYAARAKEPNAIDVLYMQHFINWSANETDVNKAEAKLSRCIDEGLVVCQLLMGAFYQRHNDADKALYHYLQLVQLDYPLSRTYLYADEMDSLLARMPKDSLAILQSRVATALINHPQNELGAYRQFSGCKHQATYACVRKVVKRDSACMIDAFAETSFADFRQTTAYRQCLNQ